MRMMRVENPGKFYVRFVRDNDQYNWVMKRLNNRTANQKSVHTKDIHIGMHVYGSLGLLKFLNLSHLASCFCDCN